MTSLESSVSFDHAFRRARLEAAMTEGGLDVLFVPLGSDLEYLVGLERDVPTYGATAYTHGWVTGAFFRPGREPVFCLPRLVALVHLKIQLPGEIVVFGESDDADALLRGVVPGLGPARTIGVASRTSAESVLRLRQFFPDSRFVDGGAVVARLRARKSSDELVAMTEAARIAAEALTGTTPAIAAGVTMREISAEIDRRMHALGSFIPSFVTHVSTYGLADRRDNLDPATADLPLRSGESVKFDYGAVVRGYCSDFGRTLSCGEPSGDFVETYEQVLLVAHEAAIAAAKPGVRAGDVDLVCRQVIEDAGFGEAFVHRAGHCLGLDLHERPYISEEEDAELEEGMVFTIEPSINVPGRFGMRIEDVVVCDASGGRRLVDPGSALAVV
jgi:Xaa-Pro aminopeptidase